VPSPRRNPPDRRAVTAAAESRRARRAAPSTARSASSPQGDALDAPAQVLWERPRFRRAKRAHATVHGRRSRPTRPVSHEHVRRVRRLLAAAHASGREPSAGTVAALGGLLATPRRTPARSVWSERDVTPPRSIEMLISSTNDIVASCDSKPRGRRSSAQAHLAADCRVRGPRAADHATPGETALARGRDR